MDNVSEEGLVPLRREEDIETTVGEKMSEEELISIIGDYDAMIVRSATKVTGDVLAAGTRLKVVGRAGVGVDNIDLEAATRQGVLVVNAPDGNTIAATEHTIAMMLALARNIPQAAAKMRDGVWDKKLFTGVELRGKVLGIVGLGRIGSAVAKRAQAMEMEVVAYDPYINKEKADSLAIKVVSLEDLFGQADFITIHAPKMKDTYHSINDDTIALMKDGVYIINCARGGVIDEAALYRAMLSRKVAGAALDVFEKEPTVDSPLLKLPNFIATPHLGASTREAQLNVALDVAGEIVAVLRGRMAKNAVNIPSISPQTLAVVGPYLTLAEKLGGLLAQLVYGRVHKLEVIYSGEVFKGDVTPLTTAVVKGSLDPILQEAVNFVNAPVLARNRGIQVMQSIDGEALGYTNLITLKVYTDQEEKSVAGTLFGKNDSRLVLIDGYRIDTVPSGYLLYIPHLDKPRIIGPVGVLIGEHDINIASMQVGRKDRGGRAVMMLSVDAPVPEETLKEIACIEGVLDVRMISL
ncbi:MAG TPA: phosphoglycerate dehydrogenase [Desulfotomaculum sp.]|jgi:D-3-phosphoglycerate dehydrogenase|nr:phosphoglycerate dehydrogenase [Desulfotomaculum sp.]